MADGTQPEPLTAATISAEVQSSVPSRVRSAMTPAFCGANELHHEQRRNSIVGLLGGAGIVQGIVADAFAVAKAKAGPFVSDEILTLRRVADALAKGTLENIKDNFNDAGSVGEIVTAVADRIEALFPLLGDGGDPAAASAASPASPGNGQQQAPKAKTSDRVGETPPPNSVEAEPQGTQHARPEPPEHEDHTTGRDGGPAADSSPQPSGSQPVGQMTGGGAITPEIDLSPSNPEADPDKDTHRGPSVGNSPAAVGGTGTTAG